VPPADDAQARGRRHPRLLDVPAAVDLADGAADLVAERHRRPVGGLGAHLPARADRARLGVHHGRYVPARRHPAADDGRDRELPRPCVRRDPGPPALLAGPDGAWPGRAAGRGDTELSTHIAAGPGEIAPVVLLPGDPLRARWIAETFLDDARCYNEVRG